LYLRLLRMPDFFLYSLRLLQSGICICRHAHINFYVD
jgi:hypothetical protein